MFKAIDSPAAKPLHVRLSAGLLAGRCTLETTAVMTPQIDALRLEFSADARRAAAGILAARTRVDNADSAGGEFPGPALPAGLGIVFTDEAVQQVGLKADVSAVNALQVQNDALRRDLNLKGPLTVDALAARIPRSGGPRCRECDDDRTADRRERSLAIGHGGTRG